MQEVIPFLILFPICIAAIMALVRANKLRNAIAYISSAVIIAAVIYLLVLWVQNGCEAVLFNLESELVDKVILGAEIALMVLVTWLSFKHRKYWVSLLSIIPTCLIAWLDLSGIELRGSAVIRLDHLSILMCLIVGIIGALIIVYAVGYMVGYHEHHTDIQDRRYYFFMLLFLFLGAMFGFVLSENLLWIDFFWELTSICSFLLIGYTREKEAINNSFRALWMNLLGGTALAIGIVYFALQTGNISLSSLVHLGEARNAAAVLPVALIAFAAMTKAAQLPFSTWLIGAMVAPTPSSALLHSATMVKAGIYVLFRLAPAMSEQTSGNMVAFIGGFTFLLASIMAIAQNDGKKILAFSTISNLGLMTACAGIGTSETVWAGVFLMIFHAISKSLLFQDVGATENTIHSRNVEDMHGLLYRLPRLALFMFIGIAGMFLAPFGMLISKWSALKASVDVRNILMVFFIIFGSSTTAFYWTKWMGKIISRSHMSGGKVKDATKFNEMISLMIHAVLMIALCVLFPWLSSIFINPLIAEEFGTFTNVLPAQIQAILVLLIIFVFAVPLIAFMFSRRMQVNRKLAYMGGINVGDDRSFVNSYGEPERVWLSNYYFYRRVGQRKLMMPCQVITAGVIIVVLIVIIGGVL